MAAPRRRTRETAEDPASLAVGAPPPDRGRVVDELLAGLRDSPKHVAPRFLYDEAGSTLFERICRLPEYYPTRTETAILRANLGAIVESIGERALLVEPGSGASVKTRLLLDAMPTLSGYVPVDISREFLLQAARRLGAAYPDLEILPVCADFMAPFPLPLPRQRAPSRVVFFFPGSTIGNLETDDAVALLASLRDTAGRRGGLLVGVDLVKSPGLIERAYNDSAGVTAQFNLNLLVHLNREYGADFDPSRFRHRATLDPHHRRIEMQLVSTAAQVVHLGGESVHFARGEALRTEYCHKYGIPDFGALARGAGWRSEDVWTDPLAMFSVHYLVGD
jgi:dimethylhistidine N-methyltransferase